MVDLSSELPTWPAAERNKQPIVDVLRPRLEAPGSVIEIASGTGQHVAFFAETLPHLRFQPTDVDDDHLQTIERRRQRLRLSNLLAPRRADVLDEHWHESFEGAPDAPWIALYCANMIHISPEATVEGLMRGAAHLLAKGAPLFLYGPFAIEGEHVSESNARFDESLRSRDPAWGVRDVRDVGATAARHGLELEERIAMPANNFTLVFRKTS